MRYTGVEVVLLWTLSVVVCFVVVAMADTVLSFYVDAIGEALSTRP